MVARRKNNKTVFGKPDFTFKKLKIAVFVDSEFFHGKDWETRKKPQPTQNSGSKKLSEICKEISKSMPI